MNSLKDDIKDSINILATSEIISTELETHLLTKLDKENFWDWKK